MLLTFIIALGWVINSPLFAQGTFPTYNDQTSPTAPTPPAEVTPSTDTSQPDANAVHTTAQKPSTVIDKKTLDTYGLVDALAMQCGIRISQGASSGDMALVRIHGIPSHSIKILLDDVPLPTDSTNNVDLTLLNSLYIERVEVYNYQQSLHHGSGAAIVINLRSLSQPTGKIVFGNTSINPVGNHPLAVIDGQQFAAIYGQKTQNQYYYVGASGQHAWNYYPFTSPYDGKTYINDNGEHSSIDSSFKYQKNWQEHQITFLQYATFGRHGISATYFDPNPSSSQQDVMLHNALTYQYNDRLTLIGAYAYQMRSYDSLQDSLDHYHTADIQLDYRLPVDDQGSSIRFTSDQTFYSYHPTMQDESFYELNFALVTSAAWVLHPEWQLDLGVRLDNIVHNFDSYRIAPTYNVSLRYQHASHGLVLQTARLFKNPDFTQLYYHDDYFEGNKDLKPETSYHANISYQYDEDHNQVRFDSYIYANYDTIVNLFDVNGVYRPYNLGQSQVYGFDLTYRRTISDTLPLWLAVGYNFNYSLITSYDKWTISDNKRLPYNPLHQVTTSMGYSLDKLQLAWSLTYASKEYSDVANTLIYSQYSFNLGFSINYRFNTQWQLTLVAKDLLSIAYGEHAYYPNRPASVQLSTAYIF